MICVLSGLQFPGQIPSQQVQPSGHERLRHHLEEQLAAVEGILE